MLRLASPSFLNSNGSLRIMFLSQLLLLQKPTSVQEDLSGFPTPFMRRRRWWDLPNWRTSQGARTTTGSSTSLSTTTTRDEDMEHKRSASFFSSQGPSSAVPGAPAHRPSRKCARPAPLHSCRISTNGSGVQRRTSLPALLEAIRKTKERKETC